MSEGRGDDDGPGRAVGTEPAIRPRRLGVLGTMVWDTIHRRDVRREPVEEWGGISYALGAFEAVLPDGWEIRPLVKVGQDLAEEAGRFLEELPSVRGDRGVKVVPHPNNRVELRYRDGDRRSERLSGGVPPWTAGELEEAVAGLDALYVNFISGFEMELEAALALRAGFRGPIYADLHSLFLGVGRAGLRVPRELPSWRAWLRCFDAVQMNETEFELLGRAWGDPWLLAAQVVGPELGLIAVTLAERGAAYVVAPGFRADPSRWPQDRERLVSGGAARSGRLPAQRPVKGGDPTGCGDVWGATCFGRLLAGDDLEPAMATANLMAARNVELRGAGGLHLHLAGRLAGR